MTNSPGEPEEEYLVCPSCHTPNDPLTDVCIQCGVPLSSSFVLSPLGQIQAEGFALRDATGGPPKFIILAGIWLLFFPALIGSAIFVGFDIVYYGIDWSFSTLVSLAIPVVLFVFSAVLLYQSTANYIRKRKLIDKGGAEQGNSL